MASFKFTPQVDPPQHLLPPQGRILIVDLEARDRERYGRYLRKQGFAICACASYEEGERRLKTENYDLVIIDQGTPAFEGRFIVERSVLKDRRVPVLVVTRHHNMASYLEAMQLGAVDYLEKPIRINDFIWTINTHLPSSLVNTNLAS